MPSSALGPIRLAPGYTRRNAVAYLLAACFSVCLLAFLSFIQPYTLNVNLGMAEAVQGRATLLLGVLNEIVTLLLIGPFGALSDRIGRRPVYVLGFAWIGAGFVAIPFSATFPQLVIATMFWGVGAAAVGAMLSAVLADLPEEPSRGALVGLTGLFQVAGILVVVFFLSRLPRLFAASGYEPLAAGRLTYWCAAALCLLSALLCLVGLRAGVPGGAPPRARVSELLRQGGSAAARNPRILLGYAAYLVARADIVIIGTYFSLRVMQTALERGASAPESIAHAGRVYGTAQLAALMSAVVFIFVADRLERLTVVIIAMAFAATGYLWVGATDPFSPVMYVAAIAMGVGELAAVLSAQLLLGQEAPAALRGSVLGLAGLFGSIGVLFAHLVAGPLYDEVGRSAPFYAVGACNLLVLVAAFAVRARSGAALTARR